MLASTPRWRAPRGWRTDVHWEFDYRNRNPPGRAQPSACSLCELRGSRWKYVQRTR